MGSEQQVSLNSNAFRSSCVLSESEWVHVGYVQLSKFELQCGVVLCCVIIDMKKAVSTCVGDTGVSLMSVSLVLDNEPRNVNTSMVC